jgi:hypothetical protein
VATPPGRDKRQQPAQQHPLSSNRTVNQPLLSTETYTRARAHTLIHTTKHCLLLRTNANVSAPEPRPARTNSSTKDQKTLCQARFCQARGSDKWWLSESIPGKRVASGVSVGTCFRDAKHEAKTCLAGSIVLPLPRGHTLLEGSTGFLSHLAHALIQSSALALTSSRAASAHSSRMNAGAATC